MGALIDLNGFFQYTPHRLTTTMGKIMSHEMGHNFGMRHDDNKRCICEEGDQMCIMGLKVV